MRVIDKGYDKLLWSNFELCSSTFLELKTLAKSWYGDLDLSKFDDRYLYNAEREKNELITMKQSGLTSNYFFAYRDQDGKYYLMDGFNRLFTDYGDLGDIDFPVYIKVITDELEDWRLMHIMFRLNMWKLQGRSQNSFKPDDFFDRGFRLFMFTKFGVDIWSNANDRHGKFNFEERPREQDDFHAIHKYFRNEYESCADFPYKLGEMSVLFSREKIVDDLRQITKINEYKGQFKNFRFFIDGFYMFLSGRRVRGDMGDYKFDDFLKMLEDDEKFFKKLQGMSGTDVTRQNVYKWYQSTLQK
jgi:hypothetical protein